MTGFLGIVRVDKSISKTYSSNETHVFLLDRKKTAYELYNKVTTPNINKQKTINQTSKQNHLPFTAFLYKREEKKKKRAVTTQFPHVLQNWSWSLKQEL